MSTQRTQEIAQMAAPSRHKADQDKARVGIALGIGAIVFGLAACQKAEPPLTTADRLKAVQTKQESQPDFFVQRKSVDYMADLKNLRETNQKNEKAEAAAPTPAAARAEAARAAAASAPAATPVAATPAPVVTAPAPVVTTPVSTPSPQPRPEPVVPAAAPVAAAPTPAPAARPAASADTSVTVVNREQPAFPREAIRSGVESGTVRARVSINAAGDVSNVAILDSRPARVFDREVSNALRRWKFNPGADGRTFETEINFQR
jgi:TonB family protein